MPEPGPIVRYVRSSRDLTASGVTDERWEQAMQAFERVVTARIAESGPIHFHTHTGAFVCR